MTIRRGNDYEQGALLTGACPLTSILSPEGARKFGRTRDSERQQRGAFGLAYRCVPPSPQSSPPRGRGSLGGRVIGEASTMSIRLYLPVRAPSPQSSPPMGRGSLGGRAIRRGNNEEHSAWLTGACPLTSILSPEGERKFGRTRNSERQQRGAFGLAYRCVPPHLNPLPRGGEEVLGGRAIW